MINQNLKPIDMIFRVQSISLFMYTANERFFCKNFLEKEKEKGKENFFIFYWQTFVNKLFLAYSNKFTILKNTDSKFECENVLFFI